MITTTAPVFDSAKLIRTLYRYDHLRLAKMHDLTPARTIERLREYPGVMVGLCPLVSSGFQITNPGQAAVVGGGCLGYSNADIAQLRLDYLTDTMLALAYAAWAELPCLIYLPIGEEIMTSNKADHGRWSRLGDKVEPIVRRLAEQFDHGQPIYVVRTDDTRIRGVLNQATDRLHPDLTSDSMGDLYSLRPSGKTVVPSHARLSQYRSTIATYLPDVVRTVIANAGVNHVIAAENLHQVKAINHARRLAQGTGGNVSHITHVPAPSLGGSVRMATAPADNAIIAFASWLDNAANVHRASLAVQGYWHAVWTVHRSLCRTPSLAPTVREFMATYHRLVVQEDTP